MRLVLATLAFLPVVGLPLLDTAPAHAADNPALLSILALGDSYTAGNGAGSYYPPTHCYRSANNYARQFQKIVQAQPWNQTAVVYTAACSGAPTGAFWSTFHGEAPQIDNVNTGYDIIFLTIGGNDVNFVDIAANCLIVHRAGACNHALTNAESLVNSGVLSNRILEILRAIKTRKAATAKVVIVGYPYLEGDPNYSIRHFLDRSLVKAGSRIRALGDKGDSMDQALVDQMNVGDPNSSFVFVSMHNLFEGPPDRELYARRTNPNRWLNQPWVDYGYRFHNYWYHPSPTGWHEEALYLMAQSSVPKHPIAPQSISVASFGVTPSARRSPRSPPFT